MVTSSTRRGALRWYAALLAMGAVLVPRAATAGGFQLNEMGPKLLGTALAGTGAIADDATTGFFNVAGLTRIKYGSLVGAASGVLLNLDVTADEATTFNGVVDVTGPNGSLEAAGGKDAWVPAAHLAQRINDDFVGYLGVTAPFGLETNYPDDGATRYIATLSKVITINVNPGIAWSLRRWVPGLSIGAGFNAQYGRAHLNQNALFAPNAPDLQVQVAGEDWAFGWNMGILYELNQRARIGVAYRSQVSHTLSGRVEIFTPTGVQRGGAKAGVTFPDTLVLSGYWEPLPEVLPGVALLGDFLWTHWSRFQTLGLRFTEVPLPPVKQAFDFRDAYRGSIGVQWKMTERFTFRFGSGFDGSPVSDSNRTLQLPDGNRVLLGLGGGYELWPGAFFDLGYLHLFVGDGTIDQTSSSPDHSHFQGTTESSTDVIGGQFTWNYDEFPPDLPFL